MNNTYLFIALLKIWAKISTQLLAFSISKTYKTHAIYNETAIKPTDIYIKPSKNGY